MARSHLSPLWLAAAWLLVWSGCYESHFASVEGAASDASQALPDGGGDASSPDGGDEPSLPDEPVGVKALKLLLNDTPAAEAWPIYLFETDGWVPPGCVGTTALDPASMTFDWTCVDGQRATAVLPWDEAEGAYVGPIVSAYTVASELAHARLTRRNPVVGTYRLKAVDRPGLDVLPSEPFALDWTPRTMPPETYYLHEDPLKWVDHRGQPCAFQRNPFNGDGDDHVLHIACKAPTDPDTYAVDHAFVYFQWARDGIYVGLMDFVSSRSDDWQIDADACVLAVRVDLSVPSDSAELCALARHAPPSRRGAFIAGRP
jgi:hypothetical protein